MEGHWFGFGFLRMGWNWKYLLTLSLIYFFSKGVKVWSTQSTGPRIGIGAKSLEELNRKIRLKFDLGEVWTVFSI